jgi:hypothetical protein
MDEMPEWVVVVYVVNDGERTAAKSDLCDRSYPFWLGVLAMALFGDWRSSRSTLTAMQSTRPWIGAPVRFTDRRKLSVRAVCSKPCLDRLRNFATHCWSSDQRHSTWFVWTPSLKTYLSSWITYQ